MSLLRIPATVITGFLGAGKTTLIRNILTKATDRRFALIVNEFGDIGVDGDLLATCGAKSCSADDIIELANGCICCTVADDFLPSMQKLLAQDPPPEHIIIETSGLALPQPLVQAFGWPEIKSKVMLDGVITVVDGAALAAGNFVEDSKALEAQRQADAELDHETPVEALFHDQISAANLLVVSKSDLLDSEQKQAVTEQLESLMPHATPILMSGGENPPLGAIFGMGLEDEAHARSHDHHHHDHDHDDEHDHDHHHDHDHDDFTSVIARFPDLDDHLAFMKQLQLALEQHGLYRVKGFLRVSGKALPLVVQAVGTRLEYYFGNAASDKDAGGRLVLIGASDADMDRFAASLGGTLQG